ncbi:MAG: thiamine pyrophosphate-dependent enzyme, partial [Rhodospirillales bacterium]
MSARGHNRFDVAAARQRCKAYRRRILDISQTVGALHIAPAFSCLEIVDVVYHGLMRKGGDGAYVDRFLMSKGHGCMAQYAILEDLGVLDEGELALYCKPGGRLGAHPDYGVPGIEASTGSLGHGLGMAAGMAYADKLQKIESVIYCLVGDGEMQEGSIWEAVMMAPNLGLGGLVAILDFNDYQGLGRTTETHPHFLPMTDKVRSFGWETTDVDGHDAAAVHAAIT